jgi:hypothetical protein
MEMHMDMENYLQILIDTSHRKGQALERLLELTSLQSNLIKESNLEELMKVIDERQGAISQINDIDLVFLETYNKLKKALGVQSIEEMDTNAYPLVKDLKNNIEHIMKILKEIDRLDKLNTENMKTDLDQVKDELKKIKMEKQSSKLTSAYKKKYAGAQGMFVDNQDKKY